MVFGNTHLFIVSEEFLLGYISITSVLTSFYIYSLHASRVINFDELSYGGYPENGGFFVDSPES